MRKKTAQICDFVTGYKCILEKVFSKKVRSWIDYLFHSTQNLCMCRIHAVFSSKQLHKRNILQEVYMPNRLPATVANKIQKLMVGKNLPRNPTTILTAQECSRVPCFLERLWRTIGKANLERKVLLCATRRKKSRR